jgi:hypothetical protein
VKFVGHIIDADGIRADPDKIQAIKDMNHRTFSVLERLLSQTMTNLLTQLSLYLDHNVPNTVSNLTLSYYPLVGNTNPEELNPRLQRFHMRLMRFRYTISHVPGKYLIIADAISRI